MYLFQTLSIIMPAYLQVYAQKVFEGLLIARKCCEVLVLHHAIEAAEHIFPRHDKAVARALQCCPIHMPRDALIHEVAVISFDVVDDHGCPDAQDGCHLNPPDLVFHYKGNTYPTCCHS